jgi:hypothetical protein
LIVGIKEIKNNQIFYKMKQLIIVFLSLILMSGNCKEEGMDCHLHFDMINESNQDIIIALKFTDPSGKCILSGSIMKPDSIYEYTRNNCWESILANGQTEEIYIVDPNNYNTPEIFYSCDSIEIKNTILKHYVLTLEDLKNADWTLIYP